MSEQKTIKYKKVPGIEYLATYSNIESERCGFDINWYICHYCDNSFIYDYGKSQRHDPNFCPICGGPNELVLMQDKENEND